MTIPSLRSLIFEVKSTRSELAFACVLRLGLGKCKGCFRFRHCVVFKNPSTPRMKNLKPIFQKKLAGTCILEYSLNAVWNAFSPGTGVWENDSLHMNQLKKIYYKIMTIYMYHL